MILALLVACMPKIERGPTAAEIHGAPMHFVELEASGDNLYLQATVRAGSAYDPPGKHGLAALTARAMLEGGAGPRTAKELREALEPTANDIELVVDKDFASFRLRCHRDHGELCVELFSDVLTSPRFREADVERLKQETAVAVTEELEADAEALGQASFHATLYEAHPYGHPVRGRATNVELLTSDDLRAFHQAHYVRTATTLGVAGAIDQPLRNSLRERLDQLPTTAPPERILPPPLEPDGRELVLLDAPSGITGFHLGHASDVDRNHDDWAALTLGMHVLGSHRRSSGRLFRAVRTARGLNYGTYAYPEPFVQRGWTKQPENGILRGQQYVQVWLRPTSNENAAFALKLTLDELERFVDEGISQDELDRTKAYLTKATALQALSPGRRLAYAIDAAATGTPNPLTALPALVPDLTLDQVNTAIQAHLNPEQLFIVAIAGDAQGLETALTSDDPTPITYADVQPDEAQQHRDTEVAGQDPGIETVHRQPAKNLFR